MSLRDGAVEHVVSRDHMQDQQFFMFSVNLTMIRIYTLVVDVQSDTGMLFKEKSEHT